MTGRMLREYAIDTFFFSCQGWSATAVCMPERTLMPPGKANDDGSPSGRGADRQQQAGTAGVARIGGLGELDCLITEAFDDPLLEKR